MSALYLLCACGEFFLCAFSPRREELIHINIFEVVKRKVTVPQAAEYFSLHSRNTTACCPFHPDKTPSMKLYSDHFYCFSCHKSGDVIALTAQLTGCSQGEAAKKLADAFHIPITPPKKKYATSKPPPIPFARNVQTLQEKIGSIRQKSKVDWIHCAQNVLLEYLSLLRRWEEKLRPTDVDEEWNSLLCEACLKMAEVEYMIDLTYTNDPNEQRAFYDDYHTEVERIEQRITDYRRSASDRNRTDPHGDPGIAGKEEGRDTEEHHAESGCDTGI